VILRLTLFHESNCFSPSNPDLADNPGVYQYYDKEGKILYVGRAKNLKKRVSSYFNKIHDTAKTNVLVKKIVTIKHIVVPTETDALLLENNLIKPCNPVIMCCYVTTRVIRGCASRKNLFTHMLLEEWSKTDRNILVPTRVLRRFLPY
jgi:hypothetical protein